MQSCNVTVPVYFKCSNIQLLKKLRNNISSDNNRFNTRDLGVQLTRLAVNQG